MNTVDTVCTKHYTATVATLASGTSMPIAAHKIRKALTLPRELVERVRAFRFAHQFDREGDAYSWLLERGLEAAEREKSEPARSR